MTSRTPRIRQNKSEIESELLKSIFATSIDLWRMDDFYTSMIGKYPQIEFNLPKHICTLIDRLDTSGRNW